MNEFKKIMLGIVLSAFVTSATTITTLSTNMSSVKESVVKIENKMDKFDERVRALESNPAIVLAAN